jgi:hypothetical protein
VKRVRPDRLYVVSLLQEFPEVKTLEIAHDKKGPYVANVVTAKKIGRKRFYRLCDRMESRLLEFERSGMTNELTEPPLNAEFLFHLVLDARNCAALLGDLEERYKLIHKKFDARKANFWYWTQTITSLAPIVWAATKRVTKALTGVAALVELYRKIRS